MAVFGYVRGIFKSSVMAECVKLLGSQEYEDKVNA